MTAKLVTQFDTWRPGYAGATIEIWDASLTTLLTVYDDYALTNQVDNPQVLISQTINGFPCGKFVVSVYVNQAYRLVINSTDTTGVDAAALTTLSGADASAATVRRTGGSTDITLAALSARTFHAADYGAIGNAQTGATNAATITAALGAAASAGGGVVILPAETMVFTTLSIGTAVILRGVSRDSTILQSTQGSNCITFAGDRAGLEQLTLDGVNKGASSVGVFARNKTETIFRDVLVKNFETGIKYQGGKRTRWRELDIDNCVTGASLKGDLNASGASDGNDFFDFHWVNGYVSNCTTYGVLIGYLDKKCWHLKFEVVVFDSNTGTAMWVNGARHVEWHHCSWLANTHGLKILDDTTSTLTARMSNTCVGLHFIGGRMENGDFLAQDTCLDVLLDRLELKGVTFTLTNPTNPLMFRDCLEDTQVSIGGTSAKVIRWANNNEGGTFGQTTDATATKAWFVTLDPGDQVYLEFMVHGRRRDAAEFFIGHYVCGGYRPGASLAYDTQTVNFAANRTLTGGTSGATALIQADSDSGATGTLTLVNIVGTFTAGETITDSGGGSARVVSGLSFNNASVDSVGAVALRTAVNASSFGTPTVVANGGDIEVKVTGKASSTIEWTVYVRNVLNG